MKEETIIKCEFCDINYADSSEMTLMICPECGGRLKEVPASVFIEESHKESIKENSDRYTMESNQTSINPNISDFVNDKTQTLILSPNVKKTCSSCSFYWGSKCVAYSNLDHKNAVSTCEQDKTYKPHNKWNCKDCGYEINLNDKNCDHCGAKIVVGNTFIAVAVSIIVVLITILIGIAIAGWIDPPTDKIYIIQILFLIIATIMWAIIKPIYYSLKSKRILIRKGV